MTGFGEVIFYQLRVELVVGRQVSLVSVDEVPIISYTETRIVRDSDVAVRVDGV